MTFSAGALSVNLADYNEGSASFHADSHGLSDMEFRHYPKSEKCHEFNILEFTGRDGESLSIYLNEAQIVELVEKGCEILAGTSGPVIVND
jgi:hypothetical protein